MEERPNPNRIYPEELIQLLQLKWWDFAGDDLAEFLPVLCEPDLEKAAERIRRRLLPKEGQQAPVSL